MHKVKVITDTDSSLPADVAARYRIDQVPITIQFGDDTYEAGVNINDKELVSRSAHGIQFMNRDYAAYRDRCLDLWGIRYIDIEVQIDPGYHPLRLPRITTNQSRSSEKGTVTSIECTKWQCGLYGKDIECESSDSVQSHTKESDRRSEGWE